MTHKIILKIADNSADLVYYVKEKNLIYFRGKRGSGNFMKAGNKKGNHKTIAAGIGIAVVAVVMAVLIFNSIYYKNRWYRHTVINGVDVSGQTLSDSEQRLREANQNYVLKIAARRGGELEIRGEEIGYSFAISEAFQKAFENQHKSLAMFYRGGELSLEYSVSFDSEKLNEILQNSVLVTGSDDYKIKKPQSATVKFSKEQNQYVVAGEDPGNTLDQSVFVTAVENALRQAKSQIDLGDSDAYPDVYQTPDMSSGSEEIQGALDACNNAALRFVTWNMGEGVKEQITPVNIAKWISYEDGKIIYDNKAIENWVENFCLKYKTVGKTRTIKSHNGKNVKIYGGDYGWQMNYEKTVKQAKAALKKKIDSSLTQNYINDPSDENKKALNIKKKVLYLNTAFKKDYEKFAVDWDTKNYTEVSLSEQMVYVFRKGKVAFKCRCITGRPVEGRRTPTGAYFIKEHREAYTLTGADYRTPVTNWVRITWTGTGFHPATWQPWSRWTKDLYKTIGSHGCVNLEPADARKIYKMTSYREAVFIH